MRHRVRLGAVAPTGTACLAAPAQAFQRTDTLDVLRAALAAAPTTDRLIARYRTAAAAGSLQSQPAAWVFKFGRAMTHDEVDVLAASLRNGDASVEYAEPDRVLHALFEPADPIYTQQGSLSDTTAGIRAPAVWKKSSDSVGVGFGAKLQPLRALGRRGGYTSDIAEAIVWAAGGVVAVAATNASVGFGLDVDLPATRPLGQILASPRQALSFTISNSGSTAVTAALRVSARPAARASTG